MTYRSDHDAALHRLDTLERELAEIRSEKPASVVAITPPLPRSRAWLALGMVGWMAAAGVCGWKLIGGLADGPASAAAEVAPPKVNDRAALQSCVNQLEVRGPAPCRPLLHLHDSLDLSYDQRGLVAMWARTEDELALTVDLHRYDELLGERQVVLRELGLR